MIRHVIIYTRTIHLNLITNCLHRPVKKALNKMMSFEELFRLCQIVIDLQKEALSVAVRPY